MLDPRILVLDEPTNHLDIKAQLELLALIRGLGTSTLAALHDVNLAAARRRDRGAVPHRPQAHRGSGAGLPDHLAVYGQASISHVQLTTLGLTNAFAEVQDRTIELNVEQLLARDPYMLVLAHSPKVTADKAMQQLREIPGAEKLTAVREGHVIPVEGSVILGGIQPIEALDDMAAMLAGFR